MGKLPVFHKFPYTEEKILSEDKQDLADYLKSLIKSLRSMWDEIYRAINTVIQDHGELSGLGDDDHTQYLKEEASGGLASEVPDHTHQNADECGQLDHGVALTGLDDDDHPQYHNDARGDARYYTETELDVGQLDTRYYTEAEVNALLAAKGFIDRGDPVNPDWTVGTFTADGAWHNLDCSAIVPEGARAIVFGIYIADNVTEAWFSMRKDGNSNTANANIIRVNVAGATLGNDGTFIVPCSTARVVEYRATNGATFLSLSVWVIGWFT